MTMINKTNVKYIDINVTLRGRGILNFDSIDQFKMYNKWRASNELEKIQSHKNLKFAKANYYDVDDKTKPGGKTIVRIPKLSGDWIRHQLFAESTPRNNSNATLSKDTLITAIAHPDSIIRGYMFADKQETIKRKSGIAVTDAELSNNAVPTLDIQSTSGARTVNSMFYRENIGDAEWKFNVVINLNELKFISMSDIYDRRAVPKDLEEAYVKKLNEYFKTNDIIPDYYAIAGGTNKIPERGILLSDDQTLILVNRILKNIISIHHGSSCTGHAWFKSMQIAFISNIGDTNEYISTDHIDALTIANPYLRSDKELAIKAEEKLAEDLKQAEVKNKKAKKETADEVEETKLIE